MDTPELTERIEVNRAGVGLGLAAAALMTIAVFLPRVETNTFGKVAENSLIQSGDGWFFIAGAVAIAGAVYRAQQQGKRTWVPTVIGLLAIGLAIYDGTGERLDLTGSNLLGRTITEHASAGIGIYAAGAAGLLSVISGSMITGKGLVPWGAAQAPARRQKQCPACAETVLAEAHICRYCGHQFSQPAQSAG